jgi:hypothetical protein
VGVRVGGALTARKQHMTEHDDGDECRDECVNGQLDEHCGHLHERYGLPRSRRDTKSVGLARVTSSNVLAASRASSALCTICFK